MNYGINHILQGPFRSAREIVLASASPRRQMLLTSLGLDFQVEPAEFIEPRQKFGQNPEEYALALAREKCRLVAEKKSGAMVLGADTIVVLNEEIMGKPASEEHALEMLTRLQGELHSVITAVSIRCAEVDIERSFRIITRVKMAPADRDVLLAYISTGEPQDKAGAYAIQGQGAFLVEEIIGSYTNVVGLPLSQVLRALLELKAVRLSG